VALLLVVITEGASRILVAVGTGAPWGDPGAILYRLYRDLDDVARGEVRRDDSTFDVLVLAGSVLHKGFGPFRYTLPEELMRVSGLRVRVHNLAFPAHTSRDSLIKYRELAHQRFDLVIVYHGINELRFNNVPASRFRLDYSHLSWYRRVNWLARGGAWTRRSAIPWAAHELRIATEMTLGIYQPIPREEPTPELMQYGGDIKTADALRANLEEISSLARERGDPLVLVAFASYLPADYSLDRFQRRQVGYLLHLMHVETWGTPGHVARRLAVHNRVIEEVARSHAEANFIDPRPFLPPEGRFWNDVCHLTSLGMIRLAAAIAEGVEAAGVLRAFRERASAP
jgi:hypothetical protein